MFDNLSGRLQMAMRRITGRGKLNESDIDEMMREVRLSLLEADVNFKVVKAFIQDVKTQAMDQKILSGLNPGQQVVKIVHDALKTMMGSDATGIAFNPHGPTVIMTVGLQGTGKTTAIGKLSHLLRKTDQKKPLLIAADIYRPAAIDQLVTLGKQLNIPVFEQGINTPVETIVKNGLAFAIEQKHDLIIIDTAGRLHIDDTMMDELKRVKRVAKPNEILLTVDAMTGQDAVNVALAFHEALEATGVILTKLDGDTRGGAALSIRHMTNLPIKFMSTGEKMDAIEVFHPERIASRILGMGDMMTLIEKATEHIDEDEALGMMEKLMSDKFNYNDLLKQFKMIKRMGSLSKIVGFMPGMGQLKNAAQNIDDRQFDMLEAIINSMTEKERKNPKLLEESRKRRERVAIGSGKSVTEVNRLRESLKAQAAMMKQMSQLSPADIAKAKNNPEALMQKSASRVKTKKGKGKGRGNFRY